MYKLFVAFLAFFGIGCGFKDSLTPAGVPNLVEFAPRMWRMGQPPNEAAWQELSCLIAKPGEPVLIVKLNDEKEGDDSPAEKLGWTVERIPLPPEDDKPWTIFVKPDPKDVNRIVQLILDAHAKGLTVAWHCSHGRDRTGMISGLLGKKLLGWSKDQAWKDMLKHGFRWELPDLDAYWIDDVPEVVR
jgi:protein-tyrosine phosphatase